MTTITATKQVQEPFYKVEFNMDAGGDYVLSPCAGTAAVLADSTNALKLHADGNSVRRYWRVDSIKERRVTELDPADWAAKYTV